MTIRANLKQNAVRYMLATEKARRLEKRITRLLTDKEYRECKLEVLETLVSEHRRVEHKA